MVRKAVQEVTEGSGKIESSSEFEDVLTLIIEPHCKGDIKKLRLIRVFMY